jgi:hypothetical protein
MNRSLTLVFALFVASPLAAQIGEKRDTVENDYGFPFLQRTLQLGSKQIEFARYPYVDKINASAFYAGGVCVAMRYGSEGKQSEDEAVKFLQKFALDDAKWKLASRHSAGRPEKNGFVTDEVLTFECVKLIKKRLALVTHTTSTIRGVETRSWDILIFDEPHKDIALAVLRLK